MPELYKAISRSSFEARGKYTGLSVL